MSLLSVKPGLIGVLAVLLLGLVALAVWGRAGDERAAPAPNSTAQIAQLPPLDRQAPAELQTATFSLG